MQFIVYWWFPLRVCVEGREDLMVFLAADLQEELRLRGAGSRP